MNDSTELVERPLEPHLHRADRTERQAAQEKARLSAMLAALTAEFDVDTEVVRGDRPCNFSMRYRSVVGEGRVAFLLPWDAVASVKGRKSVLLFSEGFIQEPSDERFRDLVAALRRNNASM